MLMPKSWPRSNCSEKNREPKMNELDELLEWVWDQYRDDEEIVIRYMRDGIDRSSNDEEQALAAKHRMDACYRVRQQIKAMQKRGQK